MELFDFAGENAMWSSYSWQFLQVERGLQPSSSLTPQKVKAVHTKAVWECDGSFIRGSPLTLF
jgi:hypothetical protein